MTRSTAPTVIVSAAAAQLNEALFEQFLRHWELPATRRTHYFGGRYENVYLDIGAVPALGPLSELARAHAAGLLRVPVAVLRYGCWFNYMGPGHATTTHTHDEDDELLSGVYYVRVPPNSGDSEFPGSDLPAHRPVAGEFVFFDPGLAHAVTANRSDAYRLSIAFNFGPRAD